MWLLYMLVMYSFLRVLALVYIAKKNVLNISLKYVFICALNILDEITIFLLFFPLMLGMEGQKKLT